MTSQREPSENPACHQVARPQVGYASGCRLCPMQQGHEHVTQSRRRERSTSGEDGSTRASYLRSNKSLWASLSEHHPTPLPTSTLPCGRMQGKHYATPSSPRNIRASTTGHTSTGSVCTTEAGSVCASYLVVHPPALLADTQPSATRDARH